jgi:hypothetical protein
MIKAIELLRATADECEQQAKVTNNRETKAELFDMTAQWHWLAREVAMLHDRSEQIERAAS